MITEIVTDDTAGFTWVDIIDPTEEELIEAALMYQLQLKPVYDCMDVAHLPKYEKHGPTAFVMVRCFDDSVDEDSCTIQELTQKLAVFITEDLLVTIHRQDTDFLRQIKKYTAYNKAEPRQAQFSILIFILQEVLFSYETPLDNAEDQFSNFEDVVFGHEADDSILGEIYLLKRKLSVYRRMLRQIIDVIRKIEVMSSEEQKQIESTRSDGERLISLTDASIDDVHNLVNLHMSFQSNRTNEIIRVLTIYSAFFMPLTFIVDLYAVSFESMSKLKSQIAYTSIWVLMALMCVGIYYWFRKKKWV